MLRYRDHTFKVRHTALAKKWDLQTYCYLVIESYLMFKILGRWTLVCSLK